MKKLIALILAAACSLSICAVSVTASSSSSIINKVVDSDGDPALSDYDTIRPGSDYYYVIGLSDDYGILTDTDYIRFTLKKKTNSKYVSDADIVEKRFNNYRYVCIKFSIKDNFTSDEYKVEMEAQFKTRKDLTITNPLAVSNGSEFPKLKAKSTSGSTRTAIDFKADYENAKKELDGATKALADIDSNLASLSAKVGATKPYDSQENKDKAAAATKAVSDNTAAVAEAKKKMDAQQAIVDAPSPPANTPPANSNIDELNGKLTTLVNEKAALEQKKIEAETAISNANAYLAAIGYDTTTSLASTNVADAGKLFPSFNGLTSLTDENVAAWNLLLTTFKASYVADSIPALTYDSSVPSDNKTVVSTQLNAVIIAQTAILTNNQPTIDNYATTKSDIESKISALEQQIADAKARNVPSPSTRDLASDQAELERLKGLFKTAQDELTKAQAVLDNWTTFNTNVANRVTAETTLNQKKTAYNKAYTDYNNYLGTTDAGTIKSGETITKSFKMWIQNEKITDDDATFIAGEKGVVIRPVKNEKNTITWERGSGYLAQVVFTASSDADFFCPRLSTYWNDADYRDYFDDSEAFVYDFTGHPTLPSTSQATLSLYNPFVDDDGELTVRESKIHVYEVDKDGDLTDKTHLFKFEENDDGDFVMNTRTRTLGTYIVSDGAADLPEKRPSRPNRPDDDRPSIDINNNKKPVPNTGR